MCTWLVSVGLCDWPVTMELEMERKRLGQGLVQAGGGLRWSPPGAMERFAAEEEPGNGGVSEYLGCQ